MRTSTSKFKNIKSHFFCLLLGLIVSACGCDQVTDPLVNTVTNNITNSVEDLRVRKPSVVNFLNLTVRQENTISVLVENIGNNIASSTTLRWYISLDPVIDSSDTEIGTNTVPILAFEGLMITNIIATTPDRVGVYYYGACVDALIGEVNTNNNCSLVNGVLVSRPDLSVVSIQARDTTVTTRNSLSLSLIIYNIGYSSFDYSLLLWYFSTDPTINHSDTEIGRFLIPNLTAGESRVDEHVAAVPQTAGVYYYGACVLRVTDEVNTANNCSAGLRVEVGYPSDFTLVSSWVSGIWSDGTNMWVADFVNDQIYAYNVLSKARVFSEDFNTLSAVGNTSPFGLWSDGTTMWVLNSDFNGVSHKIYAYNLVTKAHDPSKDFNNILEPGDNTYGDIWSDGTTMWVSVPSEGQTNDGDSKIYAYNMVTKARDPSKDFNTLPTNSLVGGRYDASGIWSDGTTMWVADGSRGKLDAYDLSTKVRVPSKDFHSVSVRGGIWSDGNNMWTVNGGLNRYNALGLVSIP